MKAALHHFHIPSTMLGNDWNEASVEYLLTFAYRYGGGWAYASSGHEFILEYMYMYTRSLREASMSGC